MSRQPWERPTLQVRARKTTVDHILEAKQPLTATSQAIKAGQIRIKPVFNLPLGISLVIGPIEALLGTGVGVIVVAGFKYGVGTVLIKTTTVLTRIVGLLHNLWRWFMTNLGKIATVLTIGEHLGVIEWCKQQLQTLWERLTTILGVGRSQSKDTGSNGQRQDES